MSGLMMSPTQDYPLGIQQGLADPALGGSHLLGKAKSQLDSTSKCVRKV